MRRAAPRLLLSLALALLLGAARDPILVPEISEHEVQLRQGFVGQELLLFGAILSPEGTRAAQDYDVVVVLKGPVQSIIVREKQKVAGIWVNAQSAEFRSAPAFFAVASSRPIAEIVDEKTAAIYELGLAYLQLSPIGPIDTGKQARFSAGLVDLMRRQGLYTQDEGGVRVSGGVLYQARIHLPSSVVTGLYTAETLAVRDGKVVASASSTVEVTKRGFERFVALAAERESILYGLFAVATSVGMGLIAGRLFALV